MTGLGEGAIKTQILPVPSFPVARCTKALLATTQLSVQKTTYPILTS